MTGERNAEALSSVPRNGLKCLWDEQRRPRASKTAKALKSYIRRVKEAFGQEEERRREIHRWVDHPLGPVGPRWQTPRRDASTTVAFLSFLSSFGTSSLPFLSFAFPVHSCFFFCVPTPVLLFSFYRRFPPSPGIPSHGDSGPGNRRRRECY